MLCSPLNRMKPPSPRSHAATTWVGPLPALCGHGSCGKSSAATNLDLSGQLDVEPPQGQLQLCIQTQGHEGVRNASRLSSLCCSSSSCRTNRCECRDVDTRDAGAAEDLGWRERPREY